MPERTEVGPSSICDVRRRPRRASSSVRNILISCQQLSALIRNAGNCPEP